jgi:ornithine cyclodeaminase/alanine dehydrogenase-like protein (mu-crystallin family)
MRYLDATATRSALSMEDAIDAMHAAFVEDREIPQRQQLGTSMFMPGRVGNTSGIKVVSTVPGSPSGIVVVFTDDGTPLGFVDGPILTAIRTGAVAGLATEILADPQASTLAMLGAGAMAPDQIAAIRAVRPIDTVLIWSRNFTTAVALSEKVGATPVRSANDAISAADVISTATPARVPLFHHSALPEGVHINAVGAYTPEMAEIPRQTVTDAYVVVDDYEAALHEAGDLIQAGRVPDIDLTELLELEVPARSGRTLFKSVGLASQDIAAARLALENAERLGLGVKLSSEERPS